MKLEQLINTYYDTFTHNDRYICECIMNHQDDCIHLSIEAFSNQYHISTSSLSRFAQKMKLQGYSELRVMLRFEKNEIGQVDHAYEVVDIYNQVIDSLINKDCSTIFTALRNASRVIVYGEGYQQVRVIQEMKRIFLPTGKPFFDMYGEDMIASLLRFAKQGDIVVFISLEGESQELLMFAKQLKAKGIYLLSITKMNSNSLAHLCDDNLYIQSQTFMMDSNIAYEVTTPYFILIELLYIKYTLYLVDEQIPSN